MSYTVSREPDAGEGWDAAFDAALAHFDPMVRKLEAGAVELRATRGPSGGSLPFLVDVLYLPNRGRVLVLDGAVALPGGGAEVASRALRQAGFPGEAVDPWLLLELLAYCGVVDEQWSGYPTWSWEDAQLEVGLYGGAPPALTAGAEGATLRLQRGAAVVERRRPVNAVERLEIRFSADAAIEVVRPEE